MNAPKLTALPLTLLLAAAPASLPAQEREPMQVEESPRVSTYRDYDRCDDCTRGRLGVSLTEMSRELREHFGAPARIGVLVSKIESGSAAERAGLRVGDVLTAIDGRGLESARDAGRTVSRRGGESVLIELYRDGSRMEVVATPDEVESYGRRWHADSDDLGIDIADFAAEMAEFGIEMGGLGVEIGTSVAEAMAAVDWEEIGESIEHSVEQSLSGVDWDELGESIGRSVEESMRGLEDLEVEIDMRELERALEKMERALEKMELEISIDRDEN